MYLAYSASDELPRLRCQRLRLTYSKPDRVVVTVSKAARYIRITIEAVDSYRSHVQRFVAIGERGLWRLRELQGGIRRLHQLLKSPSESSGPGAFMWLLSKNGRAFFPFHMLLPLVLPLLLLMFRLFPGKTWRDTPFVFATLGSLTRWAELYGIPGVQL